MGLSVTRHNLIQKIIPFGNEVLIFCLYFPTSVSLILWLTNVFAVSNIALSFWKKNDIL